MNDNLMAEDVFNSMRLEIRRIGLAEEQCFHIRGIVESHINLKRLFAEDNLAGKKNDVTEALTYSPNGFLLKKYKIVVNPSGSIKIINLKKKAFQFPSKSCSVEALGFLKDLSETIKKSCDFFDATERKKRKNKEKELLDALKNF